MEKKIRLPSASGSFYPSSPEEIIFLLTNFFQKVKEDYLFQEKIKEIKKQEIHGIISPHAGYIFSGQTAAYAFFLLKEVINKKRNVFILGPSHYLYFDFVALTEKELWSTPLGEISINQSINKNLSEKEYFSFFDKPHLPEHSLEVQLPFLQFISPKIDFQIIPLLFGDLNKEEIFSVAKTLNEYQENSLFIISTDLSHYLPIEEAKKEDEQTIKAIELLKIEKEKINACGLIPVLTCLKICQLNNWQPKLLHYSTSGEVIGDYSSVVGYASFLF